MGPRHTTAMEGGSAGFAGPKTCQAILAIVAIAHPCARDIQAILAIKKGRTVSGLYIATLPAIRNKVRGHPAAGESG